MVVHSTEIALDWVTPDCRCVLRCQISAILDACNPEERERALFGQLKRSLGKILTLMLWTSLANYFHHLQEENQVFFQDINQSQFTNPNLLIFLCFSLYKHHPPLHWRISCLLLSLSFSVVKVVNIAHFFLLPVWNTPHFRL